MSLALTKQQIEVHGVAVVQRTERDYSTKQMVLSKDEQQHVRITEVTDTHVIGYRIPTYSCMEEIPADSEWEQNYYSKHPKAMLNAPFKVKHDGSKFAFGGGSSSGTWNYYFKNIKLV